MKRAPVAVAALSSAALLAGCTLEEPGTGNPTRSPAEAAWYESGAAERRGYCAAYDAHDPQQPINVPAHRSDRTNEEFADDFYEVLKDRC
ncbi:hypothetical protein [Streptomyces pactum]|uniref:Lipoprotein n=1 Tax=Streptomyces pactum TaxID=68249 RepID=A0A1S6JDR3_9ACTN|nr:hypothetical protein [Streptomyces pactum]AQS69898.1 hypothetical protein B1H29_26155 [Streptomyces pactum]